ncbi:hypothetical protein QTO34_002205 [Cnephaeus nilssonii]|uniref:F-box domain-containing protein n=1 Tax=Cnephaeus nilssonii TaxID=3371016 RepID=A0AA40HVB9_CNENI|nr:hypothetical protein QTO34_002205 [Eptesicus nilssonii]
MPGVRSLWDNFKCTNIRIVGVPEKERKQDTEDLFEEIMAENFPYLDTVGCSAKRHGAVRFLSGVCSSRGCGCRQQRQGPAETAAPARSTWRRTRQRCADLPVEMLVEIFASLPGTDLPSLAQACTRFHSILHTDSIWRRRCREEYGLGENFRNLEVDGPMQLKPSFRIRLTERKSATVECMEGYSRPHSGHYSRPHRCHLRIQKDGFTIKCNHSMSGCSQKHLPKWVSEARGLVLQHAQWFSYRHSDCLTYRRIYLPPSHPDDLIRPGLFKGTYDAYRLKIAMLSFHGKYARATKIAGDPGIPAWKETLEIHLRHRIQLRNAEILRNFNVLSRIVQALHEQVIQELQEEEDGPEDSPAQPSVGGSGAAALGSSPPTALLCLRADQNYPRAYRMCFYGVDIVNVCGSAYPHRFPGIFILFDENQFGFLCLERKCFILYRRVQDTFRNLKRPALLRPALRKTLVAELGVADCVAAGTSFPPAAVFLWPPARSERLPIEVPLGVADRAGGRRSDWQVARRKLLLANNWCQQPGIFEVKMTESNLQSLHHPQCGFQGHLGINTQNYSTEWRLQSTALANLHLQAFSTYLSLGFCFHGEDVALEGGYLLCELTEKKPRALSGS